MTREEFERLPDDDRRQELVEGALVTRPYSTIWHSTMRTRMLMLLRPAEERGLGEVLLGVGCVLAEDTFRCPDACFIKRPFRLTPDDYIDGAPALTIEIMESSDAAREILLDPAQYLSAGGAQAVWIVYRDSWTVHVYEGRGAAARVLKRGEMLEAPGVVPDWSVPVDAVFGGGRLR